MKRATQSAFYPLLIAVLLFSGFAKAELKASPPKTIEEMEAYTAVITDDYKKAVPLLESMAAKGNPVAQSVLGQYYLKGLGVKKDYFKAEQLLEKASAQGDSESTYTIGVMYELGIGVTKNSVRGTHLLVLAAEQGSKKAPPILAAKYFDGVGAPKDNVSAHVWANIGAALGDDKSKSLRDSLENSMSKEELIEARRIAREWFAKHPADGK